jgi:N6-adenosine-specific RNA methylase IME4
VKYRTIVADPPWPYPEFYGVGHGATPPPYPTMTVAEIAALPVKDLSEGNPYSGTRRKQLREAGAEPPRDLGSHLYLWTTQAFLWDAKDIVEAWGFHPAQVLVWCKAPHGLGNGHATFRSTTEFVLFARRGTPRAQGTVDRQWFTWSRGRHSVKPEAFLDLVETVSPGPYLELFARRNRLGWDTWGNESLEHVEVAT